MVKQLLEAGADIEPKNISGRTSLTWAVIHEKAEMVKQLLEAGADIEAKDKNGSTSLIWAAYGGFKSAEMVKQLLEAGADTTGLDLWYPKVVDTFWPWQGWGTGYWHESN